MPMHPQPLVNSSAENLGGRPRVEIDQEMLARLAEMLFTASDCAIFLGCGVSTIDRRLKEAGWAGYGEFFHRHSAWARVRLRQAQWKSAMEGNASMQIWLGKQYLGQTNAPRSASPIVATRNLECGKIFRTTIYDVADLSPTSLAA